jgi:mannose-1-phosphate guanylyltransferase
MAGGSGTRLWPLSTADHPKQLLALTGERSLIQLTVDRTTALASPERILILTNARYVDAIREQLPEVPPENVVAEPVARDTSGAVALAAVIGRARFGGSVMVVLPADHIIEPVESFQEALRSAALGAASSEALYTFGITPTYPATGYGYLERGDPVQVPGATGHHRLKRFCEKPDLATAKEFVSSGRFCWNSGMFAWGVDVIWRNIELHLPDHAQHMGPLVEKVGAPDWEAALAAAFEKLPKISIDFGVMEKAADVRMVETAFRWYDVGGWPALRDFLPADEGGNHHRGELECIDAENNLVFCEDPSDTVALVGVKGLVVVRAGDKTLIMDEKRAQEVKGLANRFAEKESAK